MLYSLIIDDFTKFTNIPKTSKFNIDYQSTLFIEQEILLNNIHPDVKSSSSPFKDILYFKTEEDMVLFKLKYNI